MSERSQLSKRKAGIPARMPKPEAGPPPPGVRDAPPRLLNRGATSFPFPKLRNAVRCLHDTLPEDETYDALEPPKVPQSRREPTGGERDGCVHTAACSKPRATEGAGRDFLLVQIRRSGSPRIPLLLVFPAPRHVLNLSVVLSNVAVC